LEAAELLSKSKHAVAFTGAGISAESGVPTFRGAQGLWSSFNPEEYATPQAFAKDPVKVWEWYRWRMRLIREAKPNDAHLSIARMEELGIVKAVITQNVDDLHERAGSRNLIKLHGDVWTVKCTTCGFRDRLNSPPETVPPRCPACRGLLRPDVVWFGEPLDPEVWRKALVEASRCDVMLVVGTSGVVMPAASLPLEAKRRGAKIIEVNVERSALTNLADIFVQEPASRGLKAILEELERKAFHLKPTNTAR